MDDNFNTNSNFYILMLKDENGFLEEELATCNITDENGLLKNICVKRDASNGLHVHAKISTGKNVEDWEFNAIYDYYDDEVFGDKVIEVLEVDECENPTWEIVFDYVDDEAIMEKIISGVIEIHKKELESVFETVKDMKEEYISELNEE